MSSFNARLLHGLLVGMHGKLSDIRIGRYMIILMLSVHPLLLVQFLINVLPFYLIYIYGI